MEVISKEKMDRLLKRLADWKKANPEIYKREFKKPKREIEKYIDYGN